MRNALRSIGERSDRLCPANAVELSHAKKCGSRQSRLGWAWRRHANLGHAGDLGRNYRHQQSGRQRISPSGNIAPHRFQRAHQLPHANSGLNFATPLLRLLPLAVAANVCRGMHDGVLQLRTSSLPGLMQVSLWYAHRFALVEPIPPSCVTAQSPIPVSPDIVHDAPYRRLDLRKVVRTALFQCPHEAVLTNSIENSHHITTLFSGYSTIPCAFACLSFGINVQAVFSSMTVLTATHSPSAKGATVGFFKAGSKPRTAARSGLRTLSIKPTRPCAAIAPHSITARFSILRRRSESAQAAWFAISCVFDSSTVSIIRRWFARSELPVSVTSTMASASNGGFTSTAPHENSTLTGTFRLEK